MATITRSMASETAGSGTWQVSGAASVLLGIQSDDSAYAISVTNAGYRYFSFDSFGVPTGSTGISVTVTAKFGGNGSASSCSLDAGLVISGGEYMSGAQTAAVSAPLSWQTRTYVWSTNPATGSAWTVSGVNGVTQIIIDTPDANPDVAIGHVTINVDYTVGSTTYTSTISGSSRLYGTYTATINGSSRLLQTLSATVAGASVLSETKSTTIAGASTLRKRVYTDSFDRADSASLGSDWTQVVAGLEIVGNKVRTTAAYASSVYETGGSMTDMSVEVQAYAGSYGTRAPMPWVRANAATGTGYFAYHSSAMVFVAKSTSTTTHSVLANSGSSGIPISVQAGDKIRLEVTGTTLKVFWNDLECISYSDASYSSGYGGLRNPSATASGYDSDSFVLTNLSIPGTRSNDTYGSARLLGTYSSTIPGASTLYGTVTSTINGSSRLLQTLSSTINGASRLVQTSTSTIDGASRLKQIRSDTIAGASSLKGTYSGTIAGASTLKGTYSGTVAGSSVLKQVRSATIDGYSRLKGTYSGTIAGASVLLIVRSTTIPGATALKETRSATIDGASTLAELSDWSDWTQVHTTSPNVESWQDTDMVDGRMYEYRIKAINGVTYESGYAYTNSVTYEASSNTFATTIGGASTLKETRSGTVPGASVLKQILSGTIAGASVLKQVRSETINGASVLLKVNSTTIDGASTLQSSATTNSSTIDGYATLKQVRSGTVSGASDLTDWCEPTSVDNYGYGYIQFAWTNRGNCTGFEVYRSVNNGGGWSAFELLATAMDYDYVINDSDVVLGYSYRYYVRGITGVDTYTEDSLTRQITYSFVTNQGTIPGSSKLKIVRNATIDGASVLKQTGLQSAVDGSTRLKQLGIQATVAGSSILLKVNATTINGASVLKVAGLQATVNGASTLQKRSSDTIDGASNLIAQGTNRSTIDGASTLAVTVSVDVTGGSKLKYGHPVRDYPFSPSVSRDTSKVATVQVNSTGSVTIEVGDVRVVGVNKDVPHNPNVMTD